VSNLTLLWKGAVMQLAARPYAMAGAALLGAGVLIAPPAVPPPPLPLPVESVQVQLDQAFVPGQIIGQIVTNVIGDTVLLAGNIFTGLFGPPPSGLFPSLIQAPITFVTELIAGTPFLNALGDALALPIVALLNLGHDVVAPVVFITVRATEALVAAAQASGNLVAAVFNGVPLATALADWQQAILTVLQTPLPPGSGPAAATTLSAAATTPSVTTATNKSVSAATVSSPAASTVASVPATVKTTLTPKPQLHTVTTTPTGTSVTGSLLGTATTGKTVLGSSTAHKVAPVGVGHPTGGKTKKN